MVALKLSSGFSLFLDLVRILSAVVVVCVHLSQADLLGLDFEFASQMGRAAVMLFFVLSGFVIAYSMARSQPTLEQYLMSRASRIYSVALPVLLLAFCIVALIGEIPSPVLQNYYQVEKAYVYIPIHLVFAGEWWNINEKPPWLEPYWSLSYEVWFYIIFAIWFYLQGVLRWVTGIACCLLIGPKILMMMPIWMMGLACYDLCQRCYVTPAKAVMGFLFSWCLIISLLLFEFPLLIRRLVEASWILPEIPLGTAVWIGSDYILGLLIAVQFLCAYYLPWTQLIRFSSLIRRAASYTFTLYLSHVIVIGLWIYYWGDSVINPLFEPVGIVVSIVVATFALGQFTEHRRSHVERFLHHSMMMLSSCWKLKS